MAPNKDPRRTVGAVVHSLAKTVRSDAECKRLFGTQLWNKTYLRGIVRQESQERNNKGRMQTILVVDYALPGNKRLQREMPLRVVKIGEPPLNESTVYHPTIGQEVTPQNDSEIDSILGEDDSVVDDSNSLSTQQERQVNASSDDGWEDASTDFEEDEGVSIPCGSDMTWTIDDNFAKTNINGDVPQRKFHLIDHLGREYFDGSDKNAKIPLLEYFLAVYPIKMIQECLAATNAQLFSQNIRLLTDIGELLKFFGVVVLSTRFEFCSRRELWSRRPRGKYVPAAAFGATGMSRDRFDEIFSNLRFCRPPPSCPHGMSSEDYRWMMVDGHVESFNDHRAKHVVPSEHICGDESVVRWYGLGGSFMNKGLPHYVAIDRKPENGCEIQNIADGESGLMLQLKLVKSKNSHSTDEPLVEEEDHEDLNHGCLVLVQLLRPWVNKGLRLVCADSYFASVQTAEKLYELGFQFIGPVKTATKRFPMTYLQNIVLANRGDAAALVAKSNGTGPNLLAFLWMDRNRRTFIATGGGAAYGSSFVRRRWRQLEPVESGAEPELVDLEVPQPLACEIYYNTCAAIDQHNRCRQADLNIEKKVQTKCWHVRVNLSIFAMGVVDSFRLYDLATDSKLTQKDFYCQLAEALIDNPYQESAARSVRSRESVDSESSSLGTCGESHSVHLSPNREPKRKRTNGDLVMKQVRCSVCGKHTIRECNVCRGNNAMKPSERACCDPTTGRFCFRKHVLDHH